MFTFVLAPEHARLERLWLVGCGAMGGALLARWLAAGLPAERVTVVDPAPRGLPAGFQGRVLPDALAAFAESPDPTTVVLGIKPQALGGLAPGLGRLLGPGPLIVSMLAGIPTATLAGHFPGAPIIRMMPNLPARVGEGVTAWVQQGASKADVAAAGWLMAAAGSVHELADEALFDAVTALSGSGPAYLFRMIEALGAAGAAVGLPSDLADRLALETVAGAAALARAADVPPAELRRQVTSPGGTTEAGLAVLDGADALSALVEGAVRAAARRSAELSQPASSPAPSPSSPPLAAVRKVAGG
jgi:pyrroline-5-carboxylate reductase